MIACLVGNALFGIPIKIARIHSAHYFIRDKLFGDGHMPIDVFITPEQLITGAIKRIIYRPGAVQVLNFAQEKIQLIVIRVFADGILLGKSLSSLQELFGRNSRVLAVFRNNHSIAMKSSHYLEVGDEICFIAPAESVDLIMATLGRPIDPYKRVMVVGGGRIGASLAEALQKDYQIKIIEQNRERCEFLAQHLNDRTTVLHGSADELELLVHENIQNMDIFAAMTDDDEVNIMSSLQAKRLGAKYVIALIKRTSYADMIEGGGIDVVISPHQVMVGSILTHTRGVNTESLYVVRRGVAEAMEIVIHDDKKTVKVLGHCLADIDMPEGSKIGAILRDHTVILPTQETVIKANDHLILFISDKRYLHDIEELFG